MSAKFAYKVVGIGACTVAGSAGVAIGMLREVLRISEKMGPGEIDLDWSTPSMTPVQTPPAAAVDDAA